MEEALKFMTVDVIEELLKSIQIVQRANELSEDSDPAECEAALDHIFEFVDSLDVANGKHLNFVSVYKTIIMAYL